MLNLCTRRNSIQEATRCVGKALPLKLLNQRKANMRLKRANLFCAIYFKNVVRSPRVGSFARTGSLYEQDTKFVVRFTKTKTCGFCVGSSEMTNQACQSNSEFAGGGATGTPFHMTPSNQACQSNSEFAGGGATGTPSQMTPSQMTPSHVTPSHGNVTSTTTTKRAILHRAAVPPGCAI